MKITGKFICEVEVDNLAPETIREAADRAFESANFGQLFDIEGKSVNAETKDGQFIELWYLMRPSVQGGAIKKGKNMTLNDFTNMLFSANNEAMIRVFERDGDVDQYIAGDRGGLLFSFQSSMQPHVFLQEEYANAKVENFYAAARDEIYVIIEPKNDIPAK